jgi:hypothetical protein
VPCLGRAQISQPNRISHANHSPLYFTVERFYYSPQMLEPQPAHLPHHQALEYL